jgi:Putative auto-transporter adhesin, head GIN domain
LVKSANGDIAAENLRIVLRRLPTHDAPMKAIIITILFVGLALALSVRYPQFSRWSPLGIGGDGVVKTENREISDFSKVVVSGGFNIKWTGGKSALTVSTDQNLLPHIRTEVIDGVLRIDSKGNLRPTNGTTITISSESLADVELAGANTFTAGQLSGPALKLGSTGASTINVEGSVTTLAVNLTGASALHAKSLQTQSATLSLTGASSADVTVADTLKASLAGACSMTYSGEPKSIEKTITGACRIQQRQ